MLVWGTLQYLAPNILLHLPTIILLNLDNRGQCCITLQFHVEGNDWASPQWLSPPYSVFYCYNNLSLLSLWKTDMVGKVLQVSQSKCGCWPIAAFLNKGSVIFFSSTRRTRRIGRAADVPEPTIRPPLRSVSSSETQNGQSAPFEVSLSWQHWTWK